VAMVFLTAAGAGARFERRDDHTLIASTEAGDLLGAAVYDRPLGLARHRRVGAVFEHRDFTARILAADESGGVRSVAFRFRKPLDSPGLRGLPSAAR